MADDPKVRLTHPDLPDASFECHPDAVASWQERGWRKATATPKKKDKE